MDLKKKAIEGAVVAVIVILALVAYSFVTHKAVGPIDVNAGAVGNLLVENYIPVIQQNGGYNSALPVNTSGLLSSTGTFQVGSSGSVQSNQIVTTCAVKANTSIAATSTGYAQCTGLTGITSSDNVRAEFSTTTVGATAISDNWVIVSAHASSTAGAVDLLLLNLTGTAAVPSALSKIGSTTVITASH